MAKAHPKKKTIKIAVLGGETLLGRELQEVLKDRGTGTAVTTYASTGEGTFGEEEGETVYVEPLGDESVRDNEAILIAGTPEGATKAYNLAKGAGGRPLLIDCTGHLENQPEARIIAPLLEQPDIRATWLLVVAHPAASALGLVLTRLSRYKQIRQAIAHIFEPASEQGKKGASELHQQTTSLLAFKKLEKSVYDAQVSFNLLAQYGEEAPGKLSAIEQRIERNVATILSRRANGRVVPMPSLRLVQAPVFHGYSLSIWVEFETDIGTTELAEALASAQIEVRGQDEEAPNNIGAAGQSGLMAGDIRIDHNNPRAAWFWVVGDNLRLTADAATDLVSALGMES